MLNPKEKFTGAFVIGTAFATFVATLVVTAIFTVPKMIKPPPGDYYPDIIKCSTCWEATVFATNSDPFYQWVSDSSPDVSQRGTFAYQRASIWRVSGNVTSTNESSMYSSPDPHILGGELVKRSRTLVWKMTVYWGMSVRTCFTLPGSKDDSCLYTTPIVQTAPESYAALLVGVPYRKVSQEPYAVESSALYLDNDAVYLTNFVSNARTSAGLKLKSSGKRIKNYVYEGQECLKSPIVAVSGNFSITGSGDWFMDTFNNKVPNDKDDHFLCGMDEGQSKLADKLCTVSLENLQLQVLEKRLRESLTDVQTFMKKEWESTWSQRSDISVGIVTAVMTILVTIWGMFNRDLQEVEALILKRAGKFTRVVEATIGLPLFKTGIRGFLLLGVIVWNMFNVFVSLNAVGSEPRLATSKTLLQQLDGISFLVTTTSTVQVTPSWLIFFAACSFAIFVFATVTCGVYVRMRYVERKEEQA
ncbi:hypothetical protein SELMODRAFT_419917 [Selaginella moellendorffii]|uniref:Uncharacterized protein n=1 Tax=Selaginella moellendorffii TaxID=88036 RepID=D8SAY3_SELML|nr:hypothetical protein SELMODRAFT_419917 [Selaginella moellendorffii]